ncbi:tRNA-pseudouridine synthase [Amanita rubescens]|nr:tRNA-pseudouridine synthase [Amanita rubescens]
MTFGITDLLQKIHPSTRKRIPCISRTAKEQFKRVISSLIRAAMHNDPSIILKETPGLRKVPPYWYPYTTMAKMRWLGREILEVVSTEFRDRSMEYYRYALESGVTTINGRIAKPDTVIRDGDRIENVVHRHEPPVTSQRIKILHHDVEREFIVIDKPGSIPVHASGRYHKNSLIEILVGELGYEKVYPVNRLDRLTSGLMIIPLSADCARILTAEFQAGTVRKEYIARCKGKFPETEIVCEESLLTVDRQMGLNIVHPKGKPAKTVFNLLHYDANTNTSVIRCRPFTGRSHQLRVHLQFLGHPIANDPVYTDNKIWGDKLGAGGIDVVPSDARSAPEPPPHLQSMTELEGNPESLSNTPGMQDNTSSDMPHQKLLPRQTGEDIGMGSPVPLSSEAVGIITRLRNKKDEDEDWGRWRDVIFRAKGALSPKGLNIKPPPPQNRRKRGGKGEFTNPKHVCHPPESTDAENDTKTGVTSNIKSEVNHDNETAASWLSTSSPEGDKDTLVSPNDQEAQQERRQLNMSEALEKVSLEPEAGKELVKESGNLYCPECYLPLHPDPRPEKLYIFLHALKYTTSLGGFETEMPEWAAKGWIWDQS